MKNTKCFWKNICWGYRNGGCDTCITGAKVTKFFKKMEKLKIENEKLKVENARLKDILNPDF